MNRHLSLMMLACLCLAGPVGAALLVDPFVEDFRVGQEQLLDAPDTRGWPATLDAPAHWSAGWWDALQMVRVHERSRDPRLLAWRLDPVGLEDLLDALHEGGTGWLRREARCLDALAARAAGSDGLAARLAASLAAEPADDDWSPEERFIWLLRSRAWAGASPAESPWPELLDLPQSDRDAGWRIWRQRCAATGRRPLVGLTGDLRWARWLASLAEPDLGAAELRAAFPPEILAGLGATLLRGDSLAAHLDAYAALPTQPTVQDWWLQGRWRRDGATAEAARRLAALPGATPANRAAFLRRAADKDFSRDLWTTAVSDLEEALRLALTTDDARLLERIRFEAARARVMALRAGRQDDAQRLAALAANGDDTKGPLRDGLRDRVRGGDSPGLDDSALGDPFAAARALERVCWRLWDRIGTQHGVPAVLTDAPDDLDALRAAVAPVLAARLQGSPYREPLLRWALLLDAARLHATPLPSQSSPLPALARRAQAERDPASLHLLYGAAFLLHDPRGQLAAWILLPATGLSDEERLLLNYPLPADPTLLAELAAAEAPPELLLAIARNESLFDPAVRSYAGALGWMQIMPFHYPGRGHLDGEVLWRRRDLSLLAGSRILARDARRYDGDPFRTLAAYNAGPGAVQRWDAELGAGADAATFLAWIGYPSTRRYVEKVLIDRLAYRWIFDNFAQDDGSRPTTDRTP